jgi:hypothetical protein
MPQTWNLFRTWRNHVIRVVLITVVSCVLACTTLGHSSSNPSTMPLTAAMPGRQTPGTATVAVECDCQEGTSILARQRTTILPAMTLAGALKTTRIYRVAGLSGADTSLVPVLVRVGPHQTISAVGLIGSGHLPRPSEGSLASHGRLVLDELPEFRRHVLEVLRQPLEMSVL